MLKFVILSCEKSDSIARDLSYGELNSELSEIVTSFMPLLDDDCEVGLARVDDTLLVRIFDEGEYVFVYPIALSDGADERRALNELRLYAIREEIPLVLCDVPEEAVDTLEGAFRFTEIRGGDSCIYAFVKSELSMLCEAPSADDGVISLTPLADDDIKTYAEISKDEELNKFWGYDYREDVQNPDDEYFYLVSKAGERDGTSLSLGVRYGDSLIGEGCFWGFDLIGGAEIGFRILPKWQSRGFGRRILMLLIEIGEQMGLVNLYASVKKENKPSVSLLDSVMEKISDDGQIYKYVYRY